MSYNYDLGDMDRLSLPWHYLMTGCRYDVRSYLTLPDLRKEDRSWRTFHSLPSFLLATREGKVSFKP